MEFVHKPIKRMIAQMLGIPSLGKIVSGLLSLSDMKLGERAAQERVTLKNLDEIMDASPSLRDFLNDDRAKKAYFNAIAEYIGKDRFKAKSYAAILTQLEYLDQHLPEVARRVWCKKGHSDDGFEISTFSKTHGRSVNLILWKACRTNWLSSLEQISREGLSHPGQAAAVLISVLNKIQSFERAMLADENRSAKKINVIKRNEFYVKLRNDKQLRAVAALFLSKYLRSNANKMFFESTDADSILDFIMNLKQCPRAVLSENQQTPIPRVFLSVLKELVLDPNTLLQNELIFPRRLLKTKNGKVVFEGTGKLGTFHTRSVRAFHALWVGIAESDCKGGDPAHLDALTPARWALPMIRGSLTFFVERNGRYIGFARVVPIKNKEGTVYANLEIWAHAMTNKVVIKTQDVADRKSVTLFSLWIDEFLKRTSVHWSGVVISESEEIDNSRVKSTIMASSAYLRGEPAGPAAFFEFYDPLAFAICQLSAAPNLICDATMADAHNLRILSSGVGHGVETSVEPTRYENNFLCS
jgi:hypothetical protein